MKINCFTNNGGQLRKEKPISVNLSNATFVSVDRNHNTVLSGNHIYVDNNSFYLDSNSHGYYDIVGELSKHFKQSIKTQSEDVFYNEDSLITQIPLHDTYKDDYTIIAYTLVFKNGMSYQIRI